jgi:hypothetical protein
VFTLTAIVTLAWHQLPTITRAEVFDWPSYAATSTVEPLLLVLDFTPTARNVVPSGSGNPDVDVSTPVDHQAHDVEEHVQRSRFRRARLHRKAGDEEGLGSQPD